MYNKKHLSSLTLLILGLILSLQVGGKATAAITTPLSVYSANRHYLVNNGQPVVFLGTGQVIPTDYTENYHAYIDNLAAHKVTYARVWHFMPWASTSCWFPWPRNGGGTASDGKPKYNLDTWDTAYWGNMADACAYAQSKGVYLGIMLFDECGMESPQFSGDHRWDTNPWNPQNNVNGLSLPTSGSGIPAFYSLSNTKLLSYQENYVAKMIATTSAYPNVTYEICNEYTGPWDWEKHWIDFVSSRCSNMISVNRLGSVPSNYWSDSSIDMVKYHWGTTSGSTANSNMNSYYSQNRAVNYDETPEISSISFQNYRNLAWSCFVAGGHVHLENGVNSSAAVDAINYINGFIQTNGVHFWEMSPNNGLVTKSPGGSAYTFAKAGSEYVTYVMGSGSGTMNINLASGTSYTAKAYNPSNGSYTNLTVSGTTVSGIPSYSQDIVIYIKSTGASASNPSIGLTIAASKSQVASGDTVTYTVTYKNSGSGTASSVAISCPVPQYTSYVSGGTYTATSNTVNWTVSSVGAGASGTVSFQSKVN